MSWTCSHEQSPRLILHMLMLNLSWGGQCYRWQGP